MLDLSAHAEVAIDDLIEVMGPATVEADDRYQQRPLRGSRADASSQEPAKRAMALRGTAWAFDAAPEGFNRIMGYEHL